MATQTKIAGAGTSSSTIHVGDTFVNPPLVPWSNPGNITADDGVNTTITFPFIAGNHHESEYLRATDFGFDIPTGATILGITIVVEGSSNNIYTYDGAVRILKGGVLGNTDKATLSNGFQLYTYGASNDLWGESWTTADINSSNFGLGFLAGSAIVGGDQQATIGSIDRITATIDYTPPPAQPAPVVCQFPSIVRRAQGFFFEILRRLNRFIRDRNL